MCAKIDDMNISFRKNGEIRIMEWNKTGIAFTLHILKIHWLFLKLLILKKVSCLRMRLLH